MGTPSWTAVDGPSATPRVIVPGGRPSRPLRDVGHPVPFEFRGLRCFPSQDDPHAWSFLPVNADLERDVSGRPMLTLIDLGSSGYLSFTARWGPSASDLEALRDELATRVGVDDGRLITLTFAPIQSPRCLVSIRDRAGGIR